MTFEKIAVSICAGASERNHRDGMYVRQIKGKTKTRGENGRDEVKMKRERERES